MYHKNEEDDYYRNYLRIAKHVLASELRAEIKGIKYGYDIALGCINNKSLKHGAIKALLEQLEELKEN